MPPGEPQSIGDLARRFKGGLAMPLLARGASEGVAFCGWDIASGRFVQGVRTSEPDFLRFEFWFFGFGISLEFGAWNLGFPAKTPCSSLPPL